MGEKAKPTLKARLEFIWRDRTVRHALGPVLWHNGKDERGVDLPHYDDDAAQLGLFWTKGYRTPWRGRPPKRRTRKRK